MGLRWVRIACESLYDPHFLYTIVQSRAFNAETTQNDSRGVASQPKPLSLPRSKVFDNARNPVEFGSKGGQEKQNYPGFTKVRT